ncbi:MAG TPA: CusA/CzcA family heavy metal efflux RND transporter [Caulobacterales bacterium]|nr:CusA/CzcA family heavy metal efflux RND transporter [Caulobacterales bacterium]
MLSAIIDSAVKWRAIVAAILAVGVVLSGVAIRNAPLDAIPDISDPQIIIYAKWPRSPEVLERDVTRPVVGALVGAPGVRSIRATSHMGYSFIYVVLNNRAERAAAQRMVSDRLGNIRSRLPADAIVQLGPDASSLGWIFQYAVIDREGVRDPRELRRLNEQIVRPALGAVGGVAEVASVGGLEKQYQLKVFPPLLADSGLSLSDVVTALKSSSEDVGGRTVEVTNRDYAIRGTIVEGGIDRLEATVIGRSPAGKPVLIRDIGYIQIGYDQRRGIADLNGKGEVVGGIVVMRQGENVLNVDAQVKKRLGEVQQSLPAGVQLVSVYDRADLIWSTLRHFALTLLYELAVVILITVLFLQNLRASIAPVAVLLLGVALTAIPMWLLNQTINLFSLAGLFIAIGEMIDATIVIVENSSAELALRSNATKQERREIVLRSIKNVARPLFFSLLIILASFLPVFFLGEKEGRMFDPLVFSKTFAMIFSTGLTILALPAIILWVHKKSVTKPVGWIEHWLVTSYRRLLGVVLLFRYFVVSVGVLLIIPAGIMLATIKADFMPELEEGSILYMPTTLPGVPAREAGWVLQQIDKKLATFPEVKSVFGKAGRADTATDSAPISMVEATVTLRPRAQWRPGMTKEKLTDELNKAMSLVGFVNMWVQPISGRIAMQDSGIQTPVGIKVRGDDVAEIQRIGQSIETILKSYPATQSVVAERISSGYFVDVSFDREKLATAGLRIDEAMMVPRYAIGGENVTTLRDEDGAETPISLQYSPEYLDSLEKLRSAPVIGPNGQTMELRDIADVRVRNLPEMIRNDEGRLAGYVFVYLNRSVTPTEYVAGAKSYLQSKLELPDGYQVEWTGDYQYAAQANERFRIIVPATLIIIFFLLLAAFRSFADAFLIMLSVPFAMVGGVFLQWALGYTMTTAVVVGYIALFAVAIQTGVIMLIFIRQALARQGADAPVMDGVIDGSVMRLRPKLMTVAATSLSLLPIMLSTGPGIEIMKPIAAPTVGGMISSTIYVLILIPCLFAIGEDIRQRAQNRRKA